MRSSTARCDQILALIDACLADTEAASQATTSTPQARKVSKP
jgi:hypothetical protein